MTTKVKGESPNPAIDKAITAMMEEVTAKPKKAGPGEEAAAEQPLDMKVKVIQTAINWEKVKHSIREDEEFDPSSFGS